MYRCEFCQTVVPPNTPSVRVVVETRRVEYPCRVDANRFTRKHKIEKRHDPGGSGWEIVRERLACPACAKK